MRCRERVHIPIGAMGGGGAHIENVGTTWARRESTYICRMEGLGTHDSVRTDVHTALFG